MNAAYMPLFDWHNCRNKEVTRQIMQTCTAQGTGQNRVMSCWAMVFLSQVIKSSSPLLSSESGGISSSII